MRIHQAFAAAAAAALFGSTGAEAYPGGTPNYQTDVAPYCASCHSSRSAEALAGVGERAEKEVAERKHIAVILAGEKGYASLGEADRKILAEQIRALDVASSVSMKAPPSVVVGQEFDVMVQVTGGAGPAVGVALVDANHRWFARPASSVGFVTVAPPDIEGPDGKPQVDWLSKRPESQLRNLSFVNVTGIASDSAAKQWASARVTFHLRAPDRPGSYPLTAVYLYGTEKSSVLGYTTNPVGWKEVRGGVGGGSGRVMFTPVQQVIVASPEPE
ncbi:MAG: hypothetical protein JRG80_11575 [Deltaproteobacteria bacterium]|nr:hypothetical protein [Deltaproteobacteria bacterium]MBW2399898.1 hypothetical protein [Deltaproteobacteria bacterium]MBW2665180.1 hypothetical protein [Deltaproteobacteria bacterium]